jgi:glycosyltransferase involved in cell wall biosynthesis
VRWCPGRLAQASWKRLRWPPFDRLAGPADVFHFPNFIVPPLREGRAVVTIHDMSFVRFPHFAEARNLAYLEARIRDTARRADAIITDSRFSAAEIGSLLGVEAGRLHPIPLGIAADFRRPDDETVRLVRRDLDLDRPYLLTVGTIEPRKNLSFLVRVFEALTGFDGELVLAGMPGWSCAPIFERLRRSPSTSNIRYLRYVADAQLPALYAGAEAFVITSHYEGFGFPPLEAMACGTPVVSSAGGSLPEVLGDAARIVDTFDAERWTDALRAVIGGAERDRLVAAGLRRAAEFTWDATAEQTWAVYEKVAG